MRYKKIIKYAINIDVLHKYALQLGNIENIPELNMKKYSKIKCKKMLEICKDTQGLSP
jgi:hypothetical protein